MKQVFIKKNIKIYLYLLTKFFNLNGMNIIIFDNINEYEKVNKEIKKEIYTGYFKDYYLKNPESKKKYFLKRFLKVIF